jgi:hypothetical protein
MGKEAAKFAPGKLPRYHMDAEKNRGRSSHRYAHTPLDSYGINQSQKPAALHCSRCFPYASNAPSIMSRAESTIRHQDHIVSNQPGYDYDYAMT